MFYDICYLLHKNSFTFSFQNFFSRDVIVKMII